MLLLHVVYTTRPLCAHLLCQLLRAGAAFDVFQGGGKWNPPLIFFTGNSVNFMSKPWSAGGGRWKVESEFARFGIFEKSSFLMKKWHRRNFLLLDQFFKNENWRARRCLLSPLVLLIFQGGGSSTPSFPGRDVPPIFLGGPPPSRYEKPFFPNFKLYI